MIKTQDRSIKSLINIFGEQPRSIWVLVDGVEVEVPFESVKAGDTVLIQAGQTIAVDGMIAKGYATIDQRTLTGESQPVEKGAGLKWPQPLSYRVKFMFKSKKRELRRWRLKLGIFFQTRPTIKVAYEPLGCASPNKRPYR